MSAVPDSVLERLNALLDTAAGTTLEPAADGLTQVSVSRDSLVDFMTGLRDDPALLFKLILDVTGIDWYGQEPRFEVVYHVYSVDHRCRLRIRTKCSERDARVPSVVSVYPGAEWHEREVYDMFGVTFDNHPDLRRVLMPEEYEHHPLRKEFPKEGIEPEKVYRMKGGVMMPRPEGAESIPGAGSTTP